jgi:hypothetical protein
MDALNDITSTSIESRVSGDRGRVDGVRRRLVGDIGSRLRGLLEDPVAERLEHERLRDAQMFRRRGAFLPWASS